MKALPYGRQEVTESDIQSVIAVLNSSHLTQGDTIASFENAIAAYCHSKHAVSFNSATSALHGACFALGLSPGQWLWTSAISFVASANCGLYCGAQVDLVDIDPVTRNMSLDCLEEKLEQAKLDGRLPKVVVVVHLAGMPMDMRRVGELAVKFGFSVIEDASHAIGSSIGSAKVGCCEFSQITVFSFHPVKIITSGEGGVATTNDADLSNKMRMFMSHGITKSEENLQEKSDGAWYYEQQFLGYNYRLTDIHAALGLSQLDRLDDYVLRRNDIADMYTERLDRFPLVLPQTPVGSYSAFHLYIITFADEESEGECKQLFDHFCAENIFVQKHYIPIHRHPFYQNFDHLRGATFPFAERYYKRSISLPIFPAMQGQDVKRVCKVIDNHFGM